MIHIIDQFPEKGYTETKEMCYDTVYVQIGEIHNGRQ